jgi:hypothetical protein
VSRTVAIEVFHEESNFVVLQTPGRRYPGVVIQGDSLGGIVGELREAVQLFDIDREESRGCLQNAYDNLKSRLDQYHEVCRENGIK